MVRAFFIFNPNLPSIPKNLTMRTLYLLLTVLLFIVPGCAGPDGQKDALIATVGEWDDATAQVTNAINRVAEVQESATEMLAGLQGMPELKESLSLQVEVLNGLSQEAFEFVNRWQEGADQLNAIKEQAAEGSMPSGAEEELQRLQELIKAGRAKAREWNQSAEEAEALLQSAREALSGPAEGEEG